MLCLQGSKGAPLFEKSEDPIWVLDKNIPIDTAYYVDNQLQGPLMRIFEPIMDNPGSLFKGDHTRSVHVAASTTGALMKFAVKKETCLGCRAVLGKGEVVVCRHCNPGLHALYSRCDRIDLLFDSPIGPTTSTCSTRPS